MGRNPRNRKQFHFIFTWWPHSGRVLSSTWKWKWNWKKWNWRKLNTSIACAGPHWTTPGFVCSRFSLSVSSNLRLQFTFSANRICSKIHKISVEPESTWVAEWFLDVRVFFSTETIVMNSVSTTASAAARIDFASFRSSVRRCSLPQCQKHSLFLLSLSFGVCRECAVWLGVQYTICTKRRHPIASFTNNNARHCVRFWQWNEIDIAAAAVCVRFFFCVHFALSFSSASLSSSSLLPPPRNRIHCCAPNTQ